MNSKNAPWIIIIVTGYIGWWLWASRFPLELTSDDAYNFWLAIERFSVIEFRPHFPGYPAFVAMSKMVAYGLASNVPANVVVSLVFGCLIPILVAGIVYMVCKSWFLAALGFVMITVQPLLLSISLSGLSDSMALALLLFSVAALIRQNYLIAGLFVAMMLATRPAYLPLAIGLAIHPLISPVSVENSTSRIKAYFQVFSMIMLVGGISLWFVLRQDGLAYFEEGMRFTQGHFSIWGNTVHGEQNQWIQWWNSLTKGFGLYPVLIVLLLQCYTLTYFIRPRSHLASRSIFNLEVSRVQLKEEAIKTISFTSLIYWVWITFAQNPDNLRHWTPILTLFCILLPIAIGSFLNKSSEDDMGITGKSIISLKKFSSLLVAFLFFNSPSIHAIVSKSKPIHAPIQQAINWVDVNPFIDLLGTNYSVNLARASLPNQRIYDMYYPSSNHALLSAASTNPQSAWRLSGTPIDQTLVEIFPARFVGERTLYLYQINEQKISKQENNNYEQ
ncbi:hypothetical protein L4D20_14210 [Vibrio kyushuensis]|uniref:hypothetical protein n=1 Tax=Vibrio kyushuensis TaxID=2910249 RepID=UPI003D1092B9